MNKLNNSENMSFKEAIQEDVFLKRNNLNWGIGYDYIGFGKYLEQ